MALSAQKYVNDVGFENYQVIERKTLNFLDAINNNNKFYTIEIHEANGKVRLFTEYGRVGSTSTKQIRFPDNLQHAQREFASIVREKEGKGYREVALVQSSTGSNKAKELVDTTHIKAAAAKSGKKMSKKSSLHPLIQAFITQIYDEADKKLSQLVRGSVSSDGSSPLGKLSVVQIDKGRQILSELAQIIDRIEKLGRRATIKDVIDLSNQYYTTIPRSFGRVLDPNAISFMTNDKISEEFDVLKFYEDSLRMGIQFEDDDLDRKYVGLNSDLEVLDPASSIWKDINHYVVSTESHHHRVHLAVKNIFTVKQKKAPTFDDHYGNVQQLFHGSRSANLPGILSTHLKLPTRLQGVVITGAMFGGGLYFANQSTKSSQYSCSRFGGTMNKYNTAFMFLASVALGRIKEEYDAKPHYYGAPPGYDSVKGCKGRSLIHDEFIVYRENQQRLDYVIEFEPRSR